MLRLYEAFPTQCLQPLCRKDYTHTNMHPWPILKTLFTTSFGIWRTFHHPGRKGWNKHKILKMNGRGRICSKESFGFLPPGRGGEPYRALYLGHCIWKKMAGMVKSTQLSCTPCPPTACFQEKQLRETFPLGLELELFLEISKFPQLLSKQCTHLALWKLVGG